MKVNKRVQYLGALDNPQKWSKQRESIKSYWEKNIYIFKGIGQNISAISGVYTASQIE